MTKRRLWLLAGLNALASLFLLVSFARTGINTETVDGCTRQIIDFHVFWSAARLALDGQPLAALNPATLQDGFNACNTNWLPWLHPPAALAMITPFGFLPFVTAWTAFNALSLAALTFALRPFAPGPILLAVIFAPALLSALLQGQVVTLWMAGLLGAIWAMRTARWTTAGILIGALTLKPTLGLLLPIALLAIGAWRTIAVASLTALALHGLATLVYGLDYWFLLIELYGLHSLNSLSEIGEVGTMTSIAAFLARLGIPPVTAVTLNTTLAALTGAVVFVIWYKRGVGSDLSIAALTASIPLATPYLWHYDSAFLAVTALFLARHLDFAPKPGTVFLLVLFWTGAGLSLWLAATGLTSALPFILTVPPLLMLAFAASLAHSLAIRKEGR